MHTTKSHGDRLATIPTTRETILRAGSGYRTTGLLARLRAVRLAALEALCAKASPKPAWLYERRRAEPRTQTLPDDGLDVVIQDGIANGWITRETLADYYGESFAYYSAMMPDAPSATFREAAREKVEAVDAIAKARTEPSTSNTEHAVRELLEDVITSAAYAKTLQRGSAA